MSVKWAKEHPERAKEIQHRWYHKHKEEIAEQRKQWRKENPEKYQKQLAQHREWYRRSGAEHIRQTVLRTTIGGKLVIFSGIVKRPRPNHCELCGTIKTTKLDYHHWDDFSPALGLWLCSYCHHFAERLEEGYTVKYRRLKAQVEQVAKL